MLPTKVLLAAYISCAAAAPTDGSPEASSLPVVDLKYELHQAAYFNSTGNFYNFSNIRYAAAPLGVLRWKPPQPPETDRRAIQNGSIGRVCPQGAPSWGPISARVVGNFRNGDPINSSLPSTHSNVYAQGQVNALDPRITEDCLFLDVLVPQQVFDAPKTGSGAAVLVWIYGGGYTEGEKTYYSSPSSGPAGLLRRSNNNIIFVAANYRLGAFGFMSGPTLAAANGTANLGLLDQRFALEWVQQHIHLFGGDPKRVTVIGESAGGGSVMHQITAYGGRKGPVPFSQAIIQSPGFPPFPSTYAQEQLLQDFLALANVSSIEEARQLPTEDLIRANIFQVSGSFYGDFTYQPVVDGDFSPALPGQLLLNGQFDHSVGVLNGHNTLEGLAFTNPNAQNTPNYETLITNLMPNIKPEVLSLITDTLYPPNFNGSYGYTSQFERAVLTISEFCFTCNNFFLNTAYGNDTFAYLFSVPSGLHGQDILYTFYDDGGLSNDYLKMENVTTALALQEMLVSFVQIGTPQAPSGFTFPRYGLNATLFNFNKTEFGTVRDPAANERCRFWQKGIYN